MSSPPVPPRSPKRNTPKRSVLQERSRSEANEISSRLVRDTRDHSKSDIFSSTPYPTKAAHVLLPSTIRRKRGENGGEDTLSAILGPCRQVSSLTNSSNENGNSDQAKAVRAPALTLKRSVATLRDMYEAQAESSRPSTAASPALRPTTAGSVRLRSVSSSDGLSGRFAWEALHKTSSDDLALLPSLSEAVATVKKITSESSFQSRAARDFATSSPNFVPIGSSSSPKVPFYNDFSRTVVGPEDLTSSPVPEVARPSSPNLIQLGRSSSYDETTERSSSPNFVQLGSSSPSNVTTALSSSSPEPVPQSQSPKKRKRDEEGPSFAARVGAGHAITSSPPYEPSVVSSSAQEYPSPDNSVALPSSPPKRPNMQQPGQDPSPAEQPRKFSFESSSEIRSVAETHASLQEVLTSSPVPAIQYPIVRAPANSFTGLSIAKRSGRNSADTVSPRWTSRLSTVPSEWSGGRTNSKRSSLVEDLDDLSDDESNYAASRNFMTENAEANGSRVRMVSVSEADADHHEASDEISALPGQEYQYQSQYLSPTLPARSSSYLGTSSFLGTLSSSNNSSSRLNSLRTSMEHRLNSLKSFTHSRHNSLQSSQRPSSSSSAMSNSAVPSWARRYYSGVYRHQFQHMYSPASVPSSANPTASVSGSGRPSTSTSRRSKRSDRNGHDHSPRHFPLNMFRTRTRPRLEARQSHIEPGVGPLVSNPVRSRLPPPAATYQNGHPLHSMTSLNSDIHTSREHPAGSRTQSHRNVSLHPADPRAHWAGITPEQLHELESQPPPSRHSTLIPRRNRASEWSPHLHRGSARSSFRRSVWHAPSYSEAGDNWFSWRNAQVICFLFGFICPLMWFVGAFLMLPPRASPEDLENSEKVHGEGRAGVEEGDLTMDLEMRLKRQMARVDQARFQNARWWRGLNRFMCVVGVVVIAIVVTLAVLGTRGGGF